MNSTKSSPLEGKVAIVTGGSRGIGRAIAVRLAQAGASIAFSYRLNRGAADQTLQQIAEAGARGVAVAADMAHVDDVRAIFDEAGSCFGRLDILVNNAGICRVASISDVTEEEYDAMFAVNTRGLFFAMQEAAQRLEDGGRIINISSGVTILGSAGMSVYAGSKAAVEQFTMAAARELGGRGITVNTVSAGMTRTDLLNEVVPREIQERMASSAPLGRLGLPEDIADVVLFLASESGRWITGQNIRATGGAA
ncbi:MAG: glucose 1-dehydrogenase [Capsulimonadaceae bacterium]